MTDAGAIISIEDRAIGNFYHGSIDDDGQLVEPAVFRGKGDLSWASTVAHDGSLASPTHASINALGALFYLKPKDGRKRTVSARVIDAFTDGSCMHVLFRTTKVRGTQVVGQMMACGAKASLEGEIPECVRLPRSRWDWLSRLPAGSQFELAGSRWTKMTVPQIKRHVGRFVFTLTHRPNLPSIW